MTSNSFITILTCLLAASSFSFATAAEIHFRSEAAAGRGIVRLGDVAEVKTSDENEARLLEGIALVPAPAADEPRLLKRQEAQQLLQLSGIVLREHRFSGAEVTQIHAHGAQGAVPPMGMQEATATHALRVMQTEDAQPAGRPIVPATPEGRAAQAIVAHLDQMADFTAEWQAEIAMSPRVAQALSEQPILRVEGGISPWLGRQQFMLLIGNEKAPTRLPIEAEISGTAKAVTVTRTIERGALLAAQDVQLQTVTLQRGVRLLFEPQLIIGRETTRVLNAGQVVTADMFRAVRLIKRGDEIQVFSIAAGLQISEPGKAQSDGSHGDTITVEFADRRKMNARVTGVRRAEVYAMQTSRSQVQAAPTGATTAAAVQPTSQFTGR